MKTKELTWVLVRVYGLYMFLMAIGYAASAFFSTHKMEVGYTTASAHAWRGLLSLVTGAILITKTDAIVRFVCRGWRDSTQPEEPSNRLPVTD
ncbi:MAG: hypothetical protein FJY85_21990 [Deltaproteobacteria bacterium]|nr:hypothetical protein [Deltaproteobacteria bacterium]